MLSSSGPFADCHCRLHPLECPLRLAVAKSFCPYALKVSWRLKALHPPGHSTAWVEQLLASACTYAPSEVADQQLRSWGRAHFSGVAVGHQDQEPSNIHQDPLYFKWLEEGEAVLHHPHLYKAAFTDSQAKQWLIPTDWQGTWAPRSQVPFGSCAYKSGLALPSTVVLQPLTVSSPDFLTNFWWVSLYSEWGLYVMFADNSSRGQDLKMQWIQFSTFLLLLYYHAN